MSDKKDTFTAEELLAKIRESEPDYMPPLMPDNVVNMRPAPDISNIVPVSFSEMEAEEPKPLEYVFSPCLPIQGIAWVYASTGLGKTLFTLNLAYAIAGGGNFLKYVCPKPRRVLYVDGEMPYTQIHSRLMMIAKSQGELDYKENFSLLTPDKLSPFRVPNIDDPTGQEIYVQLVKKYNIEVVIFDNLSMLSSFDENKSCEWKPVQDWLLYLRSIGKTIIIVHHSGKEKQGYRGTSRMLDCADVAISLQPVSDNGLEEENIPGKKFKIVYQKNRVFGGKDALPYEVALDNGLWNYQSMEKTEMDKVVEMVNLKMTQTAIAKELLCGQSKVAKLVKKARHLGLLRD